MSLVLEFSSPLRVGNEIAPDNAPIYATNVRRLIFIIMTIALQPNRSTAYT
jgi:hypothetical protein